MAVWQYTTILAKTVFLLNNYQNLLPHSFIFCGLFKMSNFPKWFPELFLACGKGYCAITNAVSCSCMLTCICYPPYLMTASWHTDSTIFFWCFSLDEIAMDLLPLSSMTASWNLGFFIVKTSFHVYISFILNITQCSNWNFSLGFNTLVH